MKTKVVCVPSDMPGGFEATINANFEESDVYNFLEISQGDNEGIRISFYSMRHNCSGVACVDPVDAISKKASVLIVSGILPSFLHRFTDEGVEVFINASGTVSESVQSYIRGELEKQE